MVFETNAPQDTLWEVQNKEGGFLGPGKDQDHQKVEKKELSRGVKESEDLRGADLSRMV